ncbi:hypothetical protein ACQKDS_02095 [Serratia sp. NPDC078593]|uniref:hypothetical protein n=1 Tax=unclassified Serratia (in: enterobacteria) TaxID=2647522 RepID=UPI0037D2591A
MAGLVVFIICIILAVLTFKKVSNRSRTKGLGKPRALFTSLSLSLFVFFISMGVGAVIVSSDNKANTSDKVVANRDTNTARNDIYTCNKFEAITQTRQGTKHNSGFYSDQRTNITYKITDNTLITKMTTPGYDDSTDTAKFNKIADDGSRKYGNSSNNYFISVLNDNTIKVIIIDFNHNGTITQVCSK